MDGNSHIGKFTYFENPALKNQIELEIIILRYWKNVKDMDKQDDRITFDFFVKHSEIKSKTNKRKIQYVFKRLIQQKYFIETSLLLNNKKLYKFNVEKVEQDLT